MYHKLISFFLFKNLAFILRFIINYRLINEKRHDLSQVVVLAIANVSIKYVHIFCVMQQVLYISINPLPYFFISPLPIAGKVTNCLNRLIVYILRLYDYFISSLVVSSQGNASLICTVL